MECFSGKMRCLTEFTHQKIKIEFLNNQSKSNSNFSKHMFTSNSSLSMSQGPKNDDKENIHPMSSKTKPAQNEKQTPFLNNLFVRSEEINTLSTEMADLPKNFDKREQIRTKVYAFGGQPQLSHKNSGLHNVQPLNVDGANHNHNQAKESVKPKGAVKIDVKTPYNEMKENIACLDKLNVYQKAFCNHHSIIDQLIQKYLDGECTQEIEKLNLEVNTKKSIIQETNKKINNISAEMQVLLGLFKHLAQFILKRNLLLNLKKNIKTWLKK